MTTRTNYFTPPKFLTHLNGHPVGRSSDSAFEFDESDLWNNHFDQTLSSSKQRKSKHLCTKAKIDQIVTTTQTARSLPVNVPDWSNIINYKHENGEDSFDDDDDEDEEDKFVPPHEYLAKTRGASLSVEEGRGRTLKGRDMSRVRNAIWKQCGFED